MMITVSAPIITGLAVILETALRFMSSAPSGIA